jgi:hypothetical protein
MRKEGAADALYGRIGDKLNMPRGQYNDIFDNPRRDFYDAIVRLNADIENRLKAQKEFYNNLKESGVFPDIADYGTFSEAMKGYGVADAVYDRVKDGFSATKEEFADLFDPRRLNSITVPKTYSEFERDMKNPEKLKEFHGQLAAQRINIPYTELKDVFIVGINKWSIADRIKSMHIDENVIKNFSIKAKQRDQSRPSPVSPRKQSPKIDIPEQIKEHPQTSQSAYQMEKNRLIGEGWSRTMVTIGQMVTCYGFFPQKGDVDNYLEIHVGSSTDVVLKIMDCETNVCVRYVYVHGNSTYKARNIPPSRYYLKIAYGKEWYSKIENGQCIGKFLLNPLYKKGEEILDFNLQYDHASDDYNVPSYSVKLDVISSNRENEFETSTITEDEFNR